MQSLEWKGSGDTRVLFVDDAGLSTGRFLSPLISRLASHFQVAHLHTTSPEEVARALEEADMVWLEWAGPLTMRLTRAFSPRLSEIPVVCRIHGCEVFSEVITQINWSVVDQCIFVAEHKRRLFNQVISSPPSAQAVIRNGVELEKFTPAPGKTNTKKAVFIGNFNYRKGLGMMLQFFHELLGRDPSWRLYLRGEWVDMRLRLALETMIKELALENHVEFVTHWVEDLNAWLADKSHVLSFSIEESFHYIIGEGMAAGLKPAIHAWTEARQIWPERFIFRNLSEFLKIMTEEEYDPALYRRMLTDHGLDADTQARRTLEVLHNLLHWRRGRASRPVQPKAPEFITRKPNKRHIFIVGLHRSGTTIFWETFRQDERLVCFDEPFRPHLRLHCEQGRDDHKNTMREYLERPELVQRFWSTMQPYEWILPRFVGHQEAYIRELMRAGKRVCMDFTRVHAKLTHLREIAPDALIIHLVRDPRAVVTSHLKPYGKWLPGLPENFFSYEGWFNYWQYQDLARHMGLKGPAFVQLLIIWDYLTSLAEAQGADVTVRFEGFARNPEPVVRKIYELIGLEYRPLDYSRIHPPNPPYAWDHPLWEEAINRLITARRYLDPHWPLASQAGLAHAQGL